MKQLSIAIDGPAGAGKSTIAKAVARELSFIYVDTGAMYRAMGVYFKNKNIAPEDEEAIKEAVKGADVSISYEDGAQQVLLNGENVTGLIREEEIGKMASVTSIYPAVREKLVELQQKLAEEKDVVMDGRDIGTKVLPDAGLKIYLTASTKERAIRRYLELSEKGISSELSQIEKDIIERDYQDMNREVSPLCQAEDAYFLDCSHMSIDEVVDKILMLYQERTKSFT